MGNKEKDNKELDTSLKLLAKSSFVFLVGILISKALSYVFRVVIARYLHSEVYGLFSIASSVTDCLTAVFALGLGAGLVRYIAIYRGKEEQSKINHLIKTSLIIVTFTGILGAIFIFSISNFISINIFHDSNLIIFLKWFSIVIPFAVFSTIFICTLQAYEKIQMVSFIRNILYNIVELTVLIPLVLIGFGVNSLILSYIAGALSMLIASFIFCKYSLPSIFKKYSLNKNVKKQLNIELFSYSWPLIFLGLINFVFYSTDTFLIGYFLNASEVGIYNIAVPIASLLSIVPNLFLILFLPLITKEYARKKSDLVKETSKQVGKWIFLLILPFFILMFLFPGALINLLFGPEYIAAVNSLRLLSVGTFIFSIFMISENLISMAGKSKVVILNLLTTSMINVALSWVLIPRYGISGAAFATMSSYIIWSIITMIQAKRYTSVIPLKRKMLLILIVSLIPTILLLVARKIFPINTITLILLGSMFLLIYILLMFLTKCFDENDLMILKAIKNRLIKK